MSSSLHETLVIGEITHEEWHAQPIHTHAHKYMYIYIYIHVHTRTYIIYVVPRPFSMTALAPGAQVCFDQHQRQRQWHFGKATALPGPSRHKYGSSQKSQG